MALDNLLRRVLDAVYDDERTPYQRGDSGGLIDTLQNIFGQHEREGTYDNPLPASQDPYGDPADLEDRRGYGRDASYDQFPNLRPASEDPLGDPADLEEDNRRR